MSRVFISHSSRNDDWAIALRDWLVREGWSRAEDVFLDLDPERGIAAGERWARALHDAATRCEAVLFLLTEAWLASKWCADEYHLANKLNKKLFALLIEPIALDRLPGGLTAQWQVVRLTGGPTERFLTVHPRTGEQSPVQLAQHGLAALKRGLDKAGIRTETFDLLPDPQGPFGWRAPYRGLEAFEPEDAAVFFGRDADIVRGIDTLRGLAAGKPPRLMAILGASGVGKSSFLRAGLWPRLERDDAQWLPLRPLRAALGGAIEGREGLLDCLAEVHRRFELRVSRADLRERTTTPEAFVGLLRELRAVAARRVLLSERPFPLPVICLDQAEELFAAEAAPETGRFLRLVRAALDSDEAALLATIRSDSYGRMQSATAFIGVDQLPSSLGPVPQGEVAAIVREPAETLRRKAGPSAPLFDAPVIEALQAEMAGEADALPLMAVALQRLMREHQGRSATIGLNELRSTGGVAAAIETEADAALVDAGSGLDRAQRRDTLRRLFIPRLAGINRDSKMPQRRVARWSDVPRDLLPLAEALVERRLLVVKLTAGDDAPDATTIEVAHEALLRRWPTLAEVLAQDRDGLLLLDGVLLAAVDWNRASDERRPDFLVHRRSRLSDALAIGTRGPDWDRELAPARAYLAACQARDAAERSEEEASLAREQQRLREVAEAQAQTRLEQERTARSQRTARWALATLAAALVCGLGIGLWQYAQLAAFSSRIDEARAQLEVSRSQLATEKSESARHQARVAELEQRLARIDPKTPEEERQKREAQTALAAGQLDRAQNLTDSIELRNKVRAEAQFRLVENRIVFTNGWDTANIVEVSIPQLRKLKAPGGAGISGSIRFHKDGAGQLQRVFAEIEERNLLGQVTTWCGAFRESAGLIRSSLLTAHQLGMAFDINCDQLRFRQSSGPAFDAMARLAAIIEKHGFAWGGRFAGAAEPGHFQLSRLDRLPVAGH